MSTAFGGGGGGVGGDIIKNVKMKTFGKFTEKIQMNNHSDDNRLEVAKQPCSPLQIFGNEFPK
jgi:hypothetical protein